MKITDSHAHICYNSGTLSEIKDVFKNTMEHFGIQDIHVLTLPNYEETDFTQTYKGLYIKDSLNSYASANLVHFFDERDTKEEFLKQAKLFHKLGFDGYKMLEGKPSLRKRTGFRLDDPVYWGFYEYAEENGIPIVMHAADPLSFWDMTNATEYQIQKGWIYDESYPTKEDIRKEVWGIMEKFPKLKLTLAHMGFLYYNEENTIEFLERWENTAFDLCINPLAMNTIVENFELWGKFIHKHLSRFIFGTDFYPFNKPEDKTYEEVFNRFERLCKYLTYKEGFIYAETEIKGGLGLKEDELNAVFYENHRKRYGEPKKIDKELLFKCMEETLLNEKLTEAQKKDIEIIKEHFKKE